MDDLQQRTDTPTPRDYQYAVDSWRALNGFAIAAAMAADHSAHSPRCNTNALIPAILIAGFLGSGKTTLLNRILQEPGGRRIAAIVNDFGALNIDAKLIERRDGDLIALENGCVCCTSSGGITQALLNLVQQVDRLDTIVIEASGVADPMAIGLTMAAVPGVRLDGVVTIIDAASRHGNLAYADLAALIERQVAAADLVLVNKIDQVHMDNARGVVDWVRQAAPTAAVLRTRHAEVPTALILGLDEPRDLSAHPPRPPHAEFCTWTLRLNQPIGRSMLATWLQAIPASILRLKGFVRIVDDVHIRSAILQGVGRRYTLEETDRAAGMDNCLVAIALADDLDDTEVQRWASVVGAERL